MMDEVGFPGWILSIDETSNGVYITSFRDANGRVAEVHGSNYKENISAVKNSAFDIQKKVSSGWGLFLFDLCLANLKDAKSIEKQHYDETFGSWYFESEFKRFAYNGIDSTLKLKTKTGDEWKEEYSIAKADITYNDFIEVVGALTK